MPYEVFSGNSLGNEKETKASPENYTILHALVEAMHAKDKEKNKRSLLRRLTRRGKRPD
jgi:hypothetical protein